MKNWTIKIILLAVCSFAMFKFIEKFLLSITNNKGDSMEDLMKSISDLISAFVASEKQKSNDEGYQKGLADGSASVGGNPDLKFSQADLDKAVSDAVGPLNDKISAMQIEIDGMPSKIDEAVKAVKADLKDALDKLEADKLG